MLQIDTYLNELRLNARQSYIPVMRDRTAALLGELILKRQPRTILEIGTSIGTSGILALSRCNGTLTTIEIDEEIQDMARENFAVCGLSDRCNFILGDCHQVVFMMSGNSYDFIILDGPKSHYPELYNMLVPMLCDNGILFVDDTSYYNLVEGDKTVARKHRTIVTGMRKFMDIVKNDERINATVYDFEDGVVVAEKKV